MPLKVLLPSAVAVRFIRFSVLVPESGVDPVAVTVTPFTETPAPAVLLFWKVKLARFAEAVFSELLVNPNESPEFDVEVALKLPFVAKA